MKTPDIHISGIGSYLPPVMKAEDAVEAGLYDAEDFEWYGWTGATVAGDMPAPDMAIAAARQALARSGARQDDVAIHIHANSWAQGPTGWSVQHYILRQVVERDIPSFSVWQACSGLMGGIELAASYLMAAPERTAALLTGSDNVGTSVFNRWAFGLQNGVIGDSGSALVLSRTPGFARLLAINSTSTADIESLYRGDEPIFPPNSTSVVDFRQRMADAGRDLGDALGTVITRQGELRTETALRTIAEAGIGVDQITRVVHVFTGQESYLKIILDPIGLSTDQGLLEFGRDLGHLTVNDQVIGLEHLVHTGQVQTGDHVLMLAHGGGTSITSAVVRIEGEPAWRSPEALPPRTGPAPHPAPGPGPSRQRIRLTPTTPAAGGPASSEQS